MSRFLVTFNVTFIFLFYRRICKLGPRALLCFLPNLRVFRSLLVLLILTSFTKMNPLESYWRIPSVSASFIFKVKWVTKLQLQGKMFKESSLEGFKKAKTLAYQKLRYKRSNSDRKISNIYGAKACLVLQRLSWDTWENVKEKRKLVWYLLAGTENSLHKNRKILRIFTNKFPKYLFQLPSWQRKIRFQARAN